jgi:hypothetical protein
MYTANIEFVAIFCTNDLTILAQSGNLHGYGIRHVVGRNAEIIFLCKQEFRRMVGLAERIFSLRSNQKPDFLFYTTDRHLKQFVSRERHRM